MELPCLIVFKTNITFRCHLNESSLVFYITEGHFRGIYVDGHWKYLKSKLECYFPKF